MNDRVDHGGGGMTGATGDLTPDETDAPFVPGELREIADPASRARVTATQGAGAPAQRGDVGDPAGEDVDGGATDMAERESGYGSEHGLAPDHPAYRMETHTPPAAPDTRREAEHREAEPGVGGDELSQSEDRF
jgi:hypothetical protein